MKALLLSILFNSLFLPIYADVNEKRSKPVIQSATNGFAKSDTKGDGRPITDLDVELSSCLYKKIGGEYYKRENIKNGIDISIYTLSGDAVYLNLRDGKSYSDPMLSKESTDDSDKLNRAIQDAAAEGVPLILEAKSYKISSVLKLANNAQIKGVKGVTKIIIDNTFKKGVGFPKNEAAIVNEHVQTVYDAATADKISLDGIIIESVVNRPSIITTQILLANVKSGIIENCKFIKNTPVATTNLDLYAAVKNFSIKYSDFINHTKATYGGCIWIRSRTRVPSKIENATENISVYKCNFSKSSSDEVISVFSRLGHLRNVSITHCSIKVSNYSVPNVMTVLNWIDNSTPFAVVEDVEIAYNTFNISNFGNGGVIVVNQKGSTKNKISRVKIHGNVIYAATRNKVTSVIKAVNSENLIDCTVANNKIYNTASERPINYAISGFEKVTDNEIQGPFSFGIHSSKIVNGNTIKDGKFVGLYNCSQIIGNKVYDVREGIRIDAFNKYDENIRMSSNVFKLIDDSRSRGIFSSGNKKLNINSSNDNFEIENSSSILFDIQGVVKLTAPVVRKGKGVLHAKRTRILQ